MLHKVVNSLEIAMMETCWQNSAQYEFKLVDAGGDPLLLGGANAKAGQC